jgi:hypothetical protein
VSLLCLCIRLIKNQWTEKAFYFLVKFHLINYKSKEIIHFYVVAYRMLLKEENEATSEVLAFVACREN